LLWLIAHTTIFFPVLLIGLTLVAELGFLMRRASHNVDPDLQSVVESARDRLGLLLSLLLGFSLPMALPHYEQRVQLVADEASAISTVAQRAQMLPEPYRDRVLQPLREYVEARLEFARDNLDGPAMMASIDHANRIQNEMWQQAQLLLPENTNQVSPTFVQAVGAMSDMIDQRLAAEEKHIPIDIWVVLIMISALTCFVVGYCMRRRVLVGMLALPLAVAIVLSVVSELDNPQAGFVRVSQQSMLRLQQELKAESAPAR
jgi:hypothetical protein